MDNAIKEIVFDNQILNEDKMQYKNESKNDGDIKMTGINDISAKSKENHVRGGTRKVYEEKDYSFRALLEDDELTSSITEDNSYDQLDELKEMCDQFDDNTNKGGECSNIDSPLISEEDKPELENQSSSSFSFTDVPSAQQSDKDVPYFDNETDDKNVDVQEALLRCVNFNYELLLSSYLQTHFLDNSESNLLKCMECSFETEKEDKFRSHLLTHSGTRAYLSFDDDDDFEMDGKKYDYEAEETNDDSDPISVPSEIEGYKCPKCSYQTKLKSYLKTHMLVHSDSKLFKCPDCQYETNYKSHLKRHSLTHSDVKLFDCPSCTFKTNRKSSLIAHLERHLRKLKS
ncbi:Zinc finger protein [Armadillidium vulgare]|nr:Zinc finger protein [Armadillidium vulgare]